MNNNINNNKNIIAQYQTDQTDLTDHPNVTEKNISSRNVPLEIIKSKLLNPSKKISQPTLVSKKRIKLAPLAKTLALITNINQNEQNIKDAFPGLTAYQAMDSLLKNPYHQQLNYLDFSDFEDFDDNLLKEISDNFPNLNTLNLMGYMDHITIIGVRYLAESNTLKGLKCLCLAATWIRDEGAIVLGKSGGLKNLETLNLSGCGIGDEGVKAIVAGGLKNLETLQLGGQNIVGDEGLKAIAAGGLKNLKFLGLAENLKNHGDRLISIKGVEYLSNSKSLNLKHLDLAYNLIGDRKKNNIGDEVAKVIASGGALKNLIYLDLRLNGVGDEGLKNLKTLKFLKVLYLGRYLLGFDKFDPVNFMEFDKDTADLKEKKMIEDMLSHLS